LALGFEAEVGSPLPGDVLAGTEITALFSGGAVRGSTGCNSYDAACTRKGNSLAVGSIAVTERACLDPAGVMEQEGRFLGLLAGVTACRVYGHQLWLETADGRALVFRARSPGDGLAP
jgi:heat shock protein HslJ